MTQVKTISIPDDVECFIKLNEMTPADMNFSEQVRLAVGEFTSKGDITNYIKDEVPDFNAPIEEWIEYIKTHPEHVGDIMRRNAQMREILLKEKYAI